jgi:23S rRNA (cytosine1962-C5)-methyltransferase
MKMAWDLRRSLGLADDPQTTVFRLVNAEGDQLPGLIVDFYQGTAVFQAHSVGMYQARHEIAAALRHVLGDRLTGVYDKSAAALPFKAPIEPRNGWLWGSAQSQLVLENGIKFHVDWAQGQKTGFFVDQRDNRRLLAEYAQERRVLNMFGYTGGFSLYALKGGARRVDTVESSARAMEMVGRNLTLNFPENEVSHQGIQTDGFKYLKSMERDYDLIILDPPAFAKHLKALDNALKGYTRINARAMAKIRPGGLLFTFSCSQVVSREAFRQAVFTAAARTGRPARILHQLTQPADHPVDIYHPEGEYLKGLVLEVG